MEKKGVPGKMTIARQKFRLDFPPRVWRFLLLGPSARGRLVLLGQGLQVLDVLRRTDGHGYMVRRQASHVARVGDGGLLLLRIRACLHVAGRRSDRGGGGGARAGAG